MSHFAHCLIFQFFPITGAPKKQTLDSSLSQPHHSSNSLSTFVKKKKKKKQSRMSFTHLSVVKNPKL
jgi:hypothetical protein